MIYYFIIGFLIGLFYWWKLDLDTVLMALILCWAFPLLLLIEILHYFYNTLKLKLW